MSRQEFPKAVKVARLKHATRDGIIYCEECGVMVKPGRFAFDHHNPDGLTGKPTFENCRLLCSGPDSCHDKKTRKDQADIAEAKRREARELGVRTAPAVKLKSAPFARSERAASRMPKPSLPPRPMFVKEAP